MEQVETAFHIQLLGYNRPKAMIEEGDPTTYFAPDRQPTIPADVAARITSIQGLDNFLIARPAFHRKRLDNQAVDGLVAAPFTSQMPNGSQDAILGLHATPNFSGPLTPPQVSKVYNLDGLHNLGLNGQGMNIAVMSPTQSASAMCKPLPPYTKSLPALSMRNGSRRMVVQDTTSDPNVTAVGGTQHLSDNNGAWASEQGWSGSGGGLSVFYTQPAWQTGPGVKNSYSNGKRVVPDVAALADDTSPGYSIYEYGKWYAAGGTSASTPLWATAVLLMDQKSGLITKGTGNFAPLVYKLNATSVNAAFHDMTTGSNAVNGSGGRYSCTAGWDFVTGWGSVDFTRLYTALVGGSTQGASISGSVFDDKNGNGVKDPGDGPLIATVYLDLNNNGKLDPGEPSVTTDSSGNYTFTGLSAGTYYVRVVPVGVH